MCMFRGTWKCSAFHFATKCGVGNTTSYWVVGVPHPLVNNMLCPTNVSLSVPVIEVWDRDSYLSPFFCPTFRYLLVRTCWFCAFLNNASNLGMCISSSVVLPLRRYRLPHFNAMFSQTGPVLTTVGIIPLLVPERVYCVLNVIFRVSSIEVPHGWWYLSLLSHTQVAIDPNLGVPSLTP